MSKHERTSISSLKWGVSHRKTLIGSDAFSLSVSYILGCIYTGPLGITEYFGSKSEISFHHEGHMTNA
jgi:hypothetical protein